MFKKAIVLFFLILLFSGALSIRLVDPISKTLSNNDYVGSVVRGSELELIFSKEFGRFSSLELVTGLPDEFNVRKQDYLESIKLFIDVPKNALKSEYYFEIELTGRDSKLVRLYFIVEDNLLDSSINNYFSKSYVGEKASYEFSLINNSHADVNFIISSNLPFSWNEELKKEVVVPKRSIVKEELVIYPQFATSKNFNFMVSAVDYEKNFSVFLESKPTIIGKNNVFFNGLPFYSISLAPSYFFNSLISIFFN